VSTSTQPSGSSLGRKALAVLVLAIAGWFLVKAVVGFIAAIFTTVAVIVAIVAVIWAIRAL
jgi:hypothetical protein